MGEKEKYGEALSTLPPHWPGIPGRSLEHERRPATGGPGLERTGVTEAQRRLERELAKQRGEAEGRG